MSSKKNWIDNPIFTDLEKIELIVQFVPIYYFQGKKWLPIYYAY